MLNGRPDKKKKSFVDIFVTFPLPTHFENQIRYKKTVVLA